VNSTLVKWRDSVNELIPTGIFMKVCGAKINPMAQVKYLRILMVLTKRVNGTWVLLETTGKFLEPKLEVTMRLIPSKNITAKSFRTQEMW
jgi:hypothetical protein